MEHTAVGSPAALKYSLSPHHQKEKALVATPQLDQCNDTIVPAHMEDKKHPEASSSNTVPAATPSPSTHSDGQSAIAKTLSLTSSDGGTSSIHDYVFTGELPCPPDDISSIHDYLFTGALEPIEDLIGDIPDEIREQRSSRSEELKTPPATPQVNHHLQTEGTAVASGPALALLEQPASGKPGEESSTKSIHAHQQSALDGSLLSLPNGSEIISTASQGACLVPVAHEATLHTSDDHHIVPIKHASGDEDTGMADASKRKADSTADLATSDSQWKKMPRAGNSCRPSSQSWNTHEAQAVARGTRRPKQFSHQRQYTHFVFI
jgi:hypothetical protein